MWIEMTQFQAIVSEFNIAPTTNYHSPSVQNEPNRVQVDNAPLLYGIHAISRLNLIAALSG